MTAGKAIRVLELIDDASVGGGQVHVLTLVKHFDRLEFDVSVACQEEGYLVDELRRIDVPVLPVSLSNRPGSRGFRDVRKLLKDGRFDILHTHGGTAGFWGRLAAAFGFPNLGRVHTYHGLHYLAGQRAVRAPYKFVDRQMLRTTDAVICVCRADFDKGVRAGIVNPETAEVIHNGIDIERFRTMERRAIFRSQFGVAEGSVVFANVGRLHVQKGQRNLLEAFHGVKQKQPGSHLWIIGEGSLMNELRRRAEELGIESAVHFLGARNDIPDVLSAIDVFVLPSLWEGQPISLLEAMAAKKPVIATSVDGVQDIILDGKNGLLVPSGRTEALAAAMLLVGWSKSLASQLSKMAIETVTTQFSANTMARKVESLYRRVHSSRFHRIKEKDESGGLA